MIFQNLFEACRASFIEDRARILSTRKPKKTKIFVTEFTRAYRKMHLLEGLCKTLLLWRCLMEFNFGNSKTKKEIERRVVRSFFFLLNSTTPQDVELLELLRKEVNQNSILRDILELRINSLLIQNREQTLPRLKSSHYKAQDPDRLEKMWIATAERIHGIFFKIPEFGIPQARPIWPGSS